jgi:hypothetical protein
MNFRHLLLALIGLPVLFACKTTGIKEEERSTPTSGTLIVGVDETLKPMAEAEITAFTSIYRNSQITPIYASEK